MPRLPTYVILIHQRYRQTDGQTDRQTTCNLNTTLCTSASRGKNGELFDGFLSELRKLVKTCDFNAVEDSTICDGIVMGIRDDTTRRKLLQTRQLDLKTAIDICRASESASRQLRAMTKADDDDVHAVVRDIKKPNARGRPCSISPKSHNRKRTPSPDTGASIAIAHTTKTSHRVQRTARRATPAVVETTLRQFVGRSRSRQYANWTTTSTQAWILRSWRSTHATERIILHLADIKSKSQPAIYRLDDDTDQETEILALDSQPTSRCYS